jgi:hypothetical protein
MVRARLASEAEKLYQQEIGWGKLQETVEVRIDGNIENRRLDIVDSPNIRAIEYKTGYQYRSADNLWELRRDAQLVKEGWKITWVFRDQVAKPLLEELDRNGIKYTIQGKK